MELVLALLLWLCAVVVAQLLGRRVLRLGPFGVYAAAALIASAWALGPILLVAIGGIAGSLPSVMLLSAVIFGANFWFHAAAGRRIRDG